MKEKLVFVTGGVMSGLGKGICASSIARLVLSKGYDVTCAKIDPYLNCDAGTMRPTEHGEVFVTEDGGETDQDLGNYERFMHAGVPKKNNITTGQVYATVIERERRGEYLGKTVQIIPHITDEIKKRILDASVGHEVTVVEVGGTVGDYEMPVFLEAARQLRLERGADNVVFVHLTYLPVLETLGEPKTKPTQHSVKMLMEAGIVPDFIVCRSEKPVDDVRKEKLALFCNIVKEDVISNPDMETVYELPLVFSRQELGEKILRKFGLENRANTIQRWAEIVERFKNGAKTVKVAIIGKYTTTGAYGLPDAYISVNEAVRHAAAENSVKAAISWVDAGLFEKDAAALSALDDFDAVIVPGGFGSTGTEGKIAAVKYCREHGIPFLGLCFGLQLAVVEYARNACGLKDAHSSEIDPKTPHPVVDILPEQKKVTAKGGTMRLGAYPAVLKPGTKTAALYEKAGLADNGVVSERHRHRYEVNPEYHDVLSSNGLMFSGVSRDGRLVEFIELANHPFFIATQAHPEFTSWPGRPNPLFDGLVRAGLRLAESRAETGVAAALALQ